LGLGIFRLWGDFGRVDLYNKQSITKKSTTKQTPKGVINESENGIILGAGEERQKEEGARRFLVGLECRL